MINDIFKSLFNFQIDFLGEPFFAKGTIVFALLWGSLGINIVLVINGLSKLPIEYIEYGKIEGVNRFQAIRYIYMPYIKTLLITILFLSLIESISTIEIPLMLTLGGPTQSTYTLGYYMYQQAFSYNSFSNAASAGVILILIGLMVIPLFQRRLNHEKTN
jgi:ABC-type sugar transport system permease subunit